MILGLMLGSFCFSAAVIAQSSSSPDTAVNKSKQQAVNAAKARVVIPPEKARPLVVPRIDKPPAIDGKLDDEVWKQAAVFKD